MRSLATFARRGFTLVELLAVLAILAILAGLLFPVFASARRAAETTSCLSNFRNATRATMLYTADYDDGLFPMNYRPGEEPNADVDLAWPQVLRSYAGTFNVFGCPADHRASAFGEAFDPDLSPGDYGRRYYSDSLRSDIGYNAYNLAPIVRTPNGWIARPRVISSIPNPSQTFLFVESVSIVGGSYLVAPPCRYIVDHGTWVDTFQSEVVRPSWDAPDPVYTPIRGWDLVEGKNKYPQGGVGSRHGERLNVARVDGSARTLTVPALMPGCRLKANWMGSISDPAKNPWTASY